jgi:dihydroorotate dehydrogenase (fumarate)/dihydroorotate dehydrogenase
LRAGATCVDLYSAFIYQGWDIARRINRELLESLERAAMTSVSGLASIK